MQGANFYKHGMANTKLHRVWWGIIERCCDEHNKNYPLYGGRGIRICPEWRDSFKAFYDWAIASGYRDGLTIDRKDVDGNYCPENCRWATAKEQARNRRTARMLELNGEVHSLIEWSEITGLKPDTITERIKAGWTIEEALTIKKNGRYKKKCSPLNK